MKRNLCKRQDFDEAVAKYLQENPKATTDMMNDQARRLPANYNQRVRIGSVMLILIISKRMEQRLTVSCSRIAVSVFREIIPVRI